MTAVQDLRVVCRRNDVLGPRRRWLVFASLCALSFGMAIGFAAFGAWLVLPYSALEMGLVFWAFRWHERRLADWEQLIVSGDMVVVESERGGVRTTRRFNRPWVRIVYEPTRPGSVPSLGLRYSGQLVPFGEDLRPAERARLVRDLRRVLGRQG